MTLLFPIVALLAGAAPVAPAPPDPSPAPAEQVAQQVRGRPQTGGAALDHAAKELAKLRRALAEVLSRVDDARHEADLSKLLCLDERLTQIKVLLSVAERAETALTEAIVNKDEGAPIELAKIGIARAKVDVLRAEAAGCIGQLAYEVEERTQVDVEEPGDLPEVHSPIVRAEPGDPDPYVTDFGIPSAAR